MNLATRTPFGSLALLGVSLALLPAACSSDDDRPAPLANGGNGGNGGTAGSAGSAGYGGSAGGSSGGASGTAGTGGSGECVATTEFVQSCIDTGTAGCDEVTVCACNSCACLLAECVADEGCTAIRACAQEKRCMGASCAAPGVCQDVINEWGGLTGSSAGLGLAITKCLSDAECPTFCPETDGGTDGGTGGSAGAGGTGGSAGSAGTGGTGAAGSPGTGGTAGSTGTGGSAGVASTGGAAGTGGTSTGTAGSAGAAN